MKPAETLDLTDRPVRSRFWLVLGGWTAVALLMALILRAQEGLSLRYALMNSIAWYYSLGAFVWAACAFHARWALWQWTAVRALSAHILFGVVALALWAAFMVAWSRISVGPDYWPLVFTYWPFQLVTTAMAYAASLGVGLVVSSFTRERERRERDAQLAVAARDAELTAIKGQLQPHFLLNSLNSILALIEQDPAEAKRMLLRLSSLLHSVFDRFDEPFVPLHRELDVIRDYLEIERIRFGDRLAFRIDAGSDARQVAIPPFLLQPIVENAVKHGIEPVKAGGRVTITARLDGQRLRVAVVDTGPGFNGNGLPPHGRGLVLTRRRLETIYGHGDAVLETSRRHDGFCVSLELPTQPDAAALDRVA